MTMLVALFGCIVLGGWLYGGCLFRGCGLLRCGAGIVLGAVLYVALFRLFPWRSPWLTAGAVVFVGAVFSIAGSILRRAQSKSGEQTKLPRISKLEGIALALVCIMFVLYLWRTVGYDELSHFSFAAQFRNGRSVPVAHAFPDIPLKYHYGWDMLLGHGSLVSSLSLPFVSDMLSLLFLIGAILLLVGFLRMCLTEETMRAVVLLLFFLGGGFFVVASGIVLDRGGHGLSIFSLFNQHPWAFGINVFLLFLVVFKAPDIWRIPATARLLGFLFLPLLGLGLCNGTAAPFAVGAFGVLAASVAFSPQRVSLKMAGVLMVVLYATVLLFAWRLMGGMFQTGPQYDVPKPVLSYSLFGWPAYAKYMGAYLFCLAPIGIPAFLAALLVFSRERERVFVHAPHKALLAGCCLFLYPLPLLVMIENSAYWDNFCKINYFGVLAAWILLGMELPALCADIRRRNRRVAARVVFAILLLLLIHEPFVLVSHGLCSSWDHARYATSVSGKKDLIARARSMAGDLGNWIILNREAKRLFQVSRRTNKPEGNQYGFMAKYSGDFFPVAQEGGVSVVNFYDYNFLYERESEYRLHDAVDAMFAGEQKFLRAAEITHVLTALSAEPDFLEEWEKNGTIEEVALNSEEGWRLYAVHSAESAAP